MVCRLRSLGQDSCVSRGEKMNFERRFVGPGCLLLFVAVVPMFLNYKRTPNHQVKSLTNRRFHLTELDYRPRTSGSRLNITDTTPPTPPSNFRVTTNAIPMVQTTQEYLNRTWLTTHTTGPFDSSGGDLIVVCTSSHEGVTMTPSDSYGNEWISAAGPTATTIGANLWTQVWYAKNPVVGPGHTLKVELSKPKALVISVLVVRGANATAPIDAISIIANDHGSKSTQIASPAITTVSRSDLLIGFAKSSTEETFTPAAGFNAQPLASSNFLDAETGEAATPGEYRAMFDIDVAANWEAVVVAVSPSPLASNLSWAASTDNVGVAEYVLERCKGLRCKRFSQIARIADVTFNDTGLIAGEKYNYRVRAKDAAGNLSAYSSVATLDPGQP